MRLQYIGDRALDQRAVTAQDGHTHGEQALFATLWRLARPVGSVRMLTTESEHWRWKFLWHIAPSRRTSDLWSTSWPSKFDPAGRISPRPTSCNSYEEILQRRRSAGLTHIVRRTSGVSLINPGAPTFDAPGLKDGAVGFGAPEPISVAPSFGAPGAPSFRAQIKNKEVNEAASSSVITEAITHILGFIDDDAVHRLRTSCRHQAPDATDEEIAHFRCRRRPANRPDARNF